jgi:hypothetical protein
MWIFNIIPTWLLQLTFFLGIVVYLISTTLKVLPYANLFKYGSILTLIFSVYLLGAKNMDEAWKKRAHDLELKVLALQAESAEQNTKLAEKVLNKKQIILKRGQDTIQYIDREVVKNQEVVKYIETCPKLPDEIISTINKAATP